MTTPAQLDREEAARREAAKRRLRYPSLHKPDPKPVEILPTDSPEVRRSKKRYPSHHRR